MSAVQGDDRGLAVHEALDKLAAEDKQEDDMVKLRYFTGMSIQETAEALGISTSTANRDWEYARAWLYSEIQKNNK